MTPMGAVYLRVLEDLRDQIRGGLLAPGARVPSRNAIIARYGVGETAAKHALQVLAAEGLIEARAGSGSYVRRLPAPRTWSTTGRTSPAPRSAWTAWPGTGIRRRRPGCPGSTSPTGSSRPARWPGGSAWPTGTSR